MGRKKKRTPQNVAALERASARRMIDAFFDRTPSSPTWDKWVAAATAVASRANLERRIDELDRACVGSAKNYADENAASDCPPAVGPHPHDDYQTVAESEEASDGE